jgi:environmental stress-induced protein Ves
MSHYQIYPPDSFRSMPWRNGLGHTIEILAEYLPQSTDFAWRLSMADVVSDGRFSDFSGYDRTLLLLQGEGISLNHGNGQCDRLVALLQAAHFNGEAETEACLHAGPIKDFNIMARREFCSASVQTLHHATDAEIPFDGDILLVYAVDEPVNIKPGSWPPITIESNHLCRINKPSAEKVTASGSALIVIQITYLGDKHQQHHYPDHKPG